MRPRVPLRIAAPQIDNRRTTRQFAVHRSCARPPRERTAGGFRERVLREVEVANIPAMAFFVGANGTGKSTLFDVFAFLRDASVIDAAQAAEQQFMNEIADPVTWPQIPRTSFPSISFCGATIISQVDVPITLLRW